MKMLKKLNAWYNRTCPHALSTHFKSALARARENLTEQEKAVLNQVLGSDGHLDAVDRDLYQCILSRLKHLIKADMKQDTQRELWHRFLSELTSTERAMVDEVINPPSTSAITSDVCDRWERLLLRFKRFCEFYE